MKTYFILLVSVFISSSLMSQSLKDSLFKGKLKNPLSQTIVSKDTAKIEAAKTENIKNDTALAAPVPAEQSQVADVPKPDDNTMPDSLNKLYYAKQKAWERFIKAQTLVIAQQAGESRKVKKGEYYIDFDYEIGLNGRVKVSNITCSPKNEFLVETVTDIMSRPPVLAPPVYGDGKPRVASAKQQITILKK